MEEKIEDILDNNLMYDGQLDKSKAIKELLILFGVSNSLPSEREVRNNGYFKTVAEPKKINDIQWNIHQVKKVEGAVWLLKHLKSRQ